jgi:DNA-directed RNA polymerase specialized sigma24 family protein
VLWPIYAEGYSTTETAKRIGISPSAVRLLLDFFVSEVTELGRPDY